MPEKRISPAILIIPMGLGLALAVVLAMAAKVKAAPPPEGYACPYCPETFTTYEELVAHLQTEHPGETIPGYFVSLSCSNFYRTTLLGFPVDRITFNWEIISPALPVNTLLGEFYVTGPSGTKSLYRGAWEAGSMGSKTVDCVTGAHTVGITTSGVYPYRVTMSAYHWDGVKLTFLCLGEYIGKIEYTIK